MKLSKKFIKATDKLCDFDTPVAAPYFRKRFTLDSKPDKAEITICGLGFYELYINGKNITKGLLAPYISNVNDICYYDSYDISDKLNEGENTIGILLGNGMRNPFGGIVWDFEKASFRGPLCTAVCLEAFNDKGETVYELEADESFKTHPSPIIFDDIRMGCQYDARLEIPNWTDVDFDDSEWASAILCKAPNGRAELCRAEPIKYYKEIKPVNITHFDTVYFAYEYTEEDLPTKDYIPDKRSEVKDVYVYDFGENNAGVTKLKINGKPGQVITIRHMEYLVNGMPTIKNISFPQYDYNYDKYIKYAQKDVYICKGGEEEFVPKFKYDGFRYALVEGLEAEQANEDALTYLTMGSDIKLRGGFESSCPVLNQLQTMVQRSDLSNFFYFPTDCPQREKNGWTGDAAVSAEQMMLNFDAANSIEVWLDNVRLAQGADGEIPGIVPTDTWGFFQFGPVWDSVSVLLPYNIYRFKGDKKVIRDNAPMMIRYLHFQRKWQDKDGLLNYGLGDWCAPFRINGNEFISPRRFTSSAFMVWVAQRAAELFDIIGQHAEASYARSLAEELKANIRKHMIDFDTMTVIGNCQTSQALAMYAGIFNDDEYEEAVRRFMQIIKEDKEINTCGVIGLRFIYHVLADIGEADMAYKLITSTERSCYGAWVKAGATTMWESFPYEDGRKMNSQNHHFLGDVSNFFISDIVGIRPNPNLNDIAEFEIAPHFVSNLDYARAYFESDFGKLEAEWIRENGDIILDVSVPDGMHGYLKLSDNFKSDFDNKVLNGGRYGIKITEV